MNCAYKSVRTRPTHQRKIGENKQLTDEKNTNGC